VTADFADLLVRACLTFDPSQDRTADEELLEKATSASVVTALRTHMTDTECEWLYRRRTTALILEGIHTSSVVLYGEAGTGKTSLLREMQCAAVTNPTGAVPLIVLDLHRVEGQVRASQRRQQKRKILTEFVVSRLTQQLANEIGSEEVELTLFHRLMSGNEYFDPLRTSAKRGRQFALFQTQEGVTEYLKSDINRRRFEKCLDEYYSKESQLERQIHELVALAETPGRRPVVVAFDNVDRLDDMAQIETAEIARSISAGVDTLLPVILTCRNSNLPKLREIIDTLQAIPLAARPSPQTATADDGRAATTWAVASIFRRRLAVLGDDLLWERLLRATPRSGELRDEVAVAVRRVTQILDVMWPISGSVEPSEHFVELGHVLTKWHRGNVREISVSLYSLLKQMPVDPDLSPGGVAGRRVRNLLYRDLLGHGVRMGDGSNSATIDSVVQLFEAHPEPTTQPYPFYFLKFRVLRYLSTVGSGGTTLGTLKRAFRRYGVDDSSIERVVNVLANGSPASPSMIHLARGRSSTRVELLENGAYLSTHLVSKCEYLYASAVSIPSVFDDLSSNPLLPRFRRSVKLPPSDHTKVLVSSLLLVDYLMPRFEEEHPYLTRDHFNSLERARVDRFRQDFGFHSQNWFIKQVVGSIRGHANENGVVIPPVVEDRLDTVLISAERLSKMIDVRGRT